MNEDRIKELLKANKGGIYYDCFGPSRIGNLSIWEVWAKEGQEFQVRFIVSTDDAQEPQYFGQFQDFCLFAHRRDEDLRRVIQKLDDNSKREEREHLMRLLILAVASLAFIGSLIAIISFMATGKPEEFVYYTLTLLGGIIASGATMFFGVWKQPKVYEIPQPVESQAPKREQPTVGVRSSSQ